MIKSPWNGLFRASGILQPECMYVGRCDKVVGGCMGAGVPGPTGAPKWINREYIRKLFQLT